MRAMLEDTARSRAEFGNDHKLKLGLFGPNCSSGRSPIKGPHLWSGNWKDNLRMARLADDAGFDFLLPIARWKGYGGDTDYQGASLETITWATGLLAHTKNIHVFATVHVPLVHPVFAAKQFVTADHISGGRFGVNIVVGWNEDEFEMFGVPQRDHDERYAYAQEWLDAVKAMWSRDDAFDFDGKYLQLKDVRAKPKPYGGTWPLLMNAAASPIGQAYALRNCDALFTSLNATADVEQITAHVAGVKERAQQSGRDLDIYTIGIVTCAPTMQEARDYFQHNIIEQADWSVIDTLMRSRNVNPDTMSAAERDKARIAFASGTGGRPIVGDPDHVAAECARLSAAGIKGLGFSFVNYADELPFFCQEVLPRLERLGLRVPR